MKAIWKDQLVAESDDTILIEGNHYFPKDSIQKDFFKDSTSKTNCHWKGEASYYSIEVDGVVNEDAAWYYPEPSALAANIKGYVAFWKGVNVME